MSVAVSSVIRLAPELSFAEYIARQLKGKRRSGLTDQRFWRNNWLREEVWVNGVLVCSVFDKEWDDIFHITAHTTSLGNNELVKELAEQYQAQFYAHAETFKKTYTTVVAAMEIEVKHNARSTTRKVVED